MDHLTKEQSEQLLSQLRTATEGFTFNNKQVFLPLVTPTSKLIYADLYGHWAKEYGIHRQQIMDSVAILVNDVIYCEENFLDFLCLKESEKIKRMSSTYDAYIQKVKDYIITSIVPIIPELKEIPPKLETSAVHNARRKLLTPHNICLNDWPIKPIEDIMQSFLFGHKDFVFCLSSITSPESLVLDNWKQYSEDSSTLQEVQERIFVNNRTDELCTNPEDCVKEWELDLCQRLGELWEEGAKTVTCTFSNELGDFIDKQEIGELLQRIIYSGGKYKKNSQLTQVFYRGQNILGYDIPQENSLVTNALSL